MNENPPPLLSETCVRPSTEFVCAACGTPVRSRVPLLEDVPADHDPRERYAILLCPVCRTGRTDPTPSEEKLARLYQDYGSRPGSLTQRAQQDVIEKARRWWLARHARVFFDPAAPWGRARRRFYSCFLIPRVTLAPTHIDVLRSRARSRPVRILDVGCGNCEFLEAAMHAGVPATGQEVSADVADAAQALGFDVRSTPLQNMAETERFDMVRFSHSLEHMFEPLEALQHARRMLDTGGYLTVAVPQIPSIITALGHAGWYHLPYHLHHFSREGMRQLARRAGFRVISMKSKSNSMLARSVSRHLARPGIGQRPAFRLACIAAEILADAIGWGDSMEMHAVAVDHPQPGSATERLNPADAVT